MKGVSFLETSIAVGLARKFEAAYKDSWIRKSLEKLLSRIKICFRHSSLGRVTEIGEGADPEILYNSKVVRRVLKTYNILRDRIANYVNFSIIVSLAVGVKKELYFLPVKTGGIVVFTAVLTNMLLSLLMRNVIGVWGWSMRVVLLFAAFRGMFCKVGWEELKRTSYLMRHLKKQESQ